MRIVTSLFVIAVVVIVGLCGEVWGQTAAFDSSTYDSSYSECPPTFQADYIVVGGGGTGAVVARRLSDDSCSNVLLLEGGGPSQTSTGGRDFVAASYYFDNNGKAVFNKPLTRYDVPVFAPSTQDTPDSPTPVYQLNSNYGNLTSHSKILGGNSVHNNMQWIRDNKNSINKWNITGWSYDDLLPYFIKSENVSGSSVAGDFVNHGHSGPIQVNNAQAPDPIGDLFLKACNKTRYGYTPDSNGPNYVGCSPTFFNINSRGIRSSSVHEYLAPALGRPNLKMLTNALVVKVFFTDAVPPVAYKVQYEKNGVLYNVTANKEVILSAGGFNSAKILLQSGVGPASQLRSLGIPVIADVPVGKRIGLHPLFIVQFNYTTTAYNPYDISGPSVEYAVHGTGRFASVGFPANGLIKTSPELTDVDMWIIVDVTSDPGTVTVYGLTIGQRQNNGTVSLTSKDYRNPAYFNYTIFQNQADLLSMVNGIKAIRNITRTYPASTAFGAEIIPGPQYQTDAQLANYLKNGAGLPIITHLYGGNPLGNVGDTTSVLDPRARVRNVKGLRVADLSIVPGILRGAPIANVIMFGEKISAMIRQDNPC